MNKIATTNIDGNVKVWDADSGILLATMRKHTNHANGVAFSPDNSLIVSIDHNDNGCINFWNASTYQLEKSIKSEYAMNSIAFSSDGTMICVTNDKGQVLIYRISTGALIRTLIAHELPVLSAVFTLDNSKIISGGQDKVLIIWNIFTGEIIGKVFGFTDWITCIVISPDNSKIAISLTDGKICLLDYITKKLLDLMQYHKKCVNSIALSPGFFSQLIVSGDINGNIHIKDLKNDYRMLIINENTKPIVTVVFSPDGMKIVSASIDGRVNIWMIYGKLSLSFQDTCEITALAYINQPIKPICINQPKLSLSNIFSEFY